MIKKQTGPITGGVNFSFRIRWVSVMSLIEREAQLSRKTELNFNSEFDLANKKVRKRSYLEIWSECSIQSNRAIRGCVSK